MSLENSFLEEVRKLRQKKRKRLRRRIGMFLLIVGIVTGVGYLFRPGAAILSTTTPFLSILGLILIFSLVIYVIKHQSSRNRKYFLGFTLLLIALICQAHLPLIRNSVNGLVTRLVYNPTPPILNSSLSWKDRAMIHPIVAKMPSNVEISINSVAKYIAKQESDPYLRIKALHDYVVSRVTYDLEVLKTGIRPAQDAQTVFLTRKAVCEGYANLFMALGRAIGEEVVFIGGRVRKDLAPIELIPQTLRLLKSDYDWTLHAWNAVKISDNWQLVDTTWDDSDSTDASSYSADYLMPPPKVMIMSHFPDQSHWQLLHLPEDEKTFENQPILTPQFFVEGLTLISPTKYQTNVQKSAFIKIESSPNYQKKIVAIFTKIPEAESSLWNLTQSNQFLQGQQQDIRKCQSKRNGRETQISCQFQEPGEYQVFVFSGLGQKISFIGKLKFHTHDDGRDARTTRKF